MKKITEISDEIAAQIKVIFTDIDDTLSTHGKILPEAYNAMWRLYRSGIHVVPITGRCAGWVDHIARMWPVKGVIGENGAFYAYLEEKKLDDGRKINVLKKRYYMPPEEAGKYKKKLEEIKKEVFARFPTVKTASDQKFREFDLAIDFCEDVPPLPMEDVLKIAEIFRKHGANVKISSIHVNGWFGDFDKLKMTLIFSKEILGMDEKTLRNRAIFIGDSQNDQPMFGFFPHSIGVANINRFIGILEKFPGYITENEAGLGFAEMTDVILKKRARYFGNMATVGGGPESRKSNKTKNIHASDFTD